MERNCIVHKYIHKQSWDRRTGELLEDSLTKVPLDMSLDAFISHKKEPNKMNYLQASELYKALHEGKIVQVKRFHTPLVESKFRDCLDPNPDFWTIGTEWRIKPEPREFSILVYPSGHICNSRDVLPEGRKQGVTLVKVREVLED